MTPSLWPEGEGEGEGEGEIEGHYGGGRFVG